MNKKEFQIATGIVFDKIFKVRFERLKNKGVIQPFDENFYSQFDGMLYNATPIDYYIKCMSMGRCYDASAVLGLAFGKTREDVYICRGNLIMAGLSINGSFSFGHGWVEKGGFVYDTTWKVVMPKRTYYNLFGVQVYSKRTAKQFFKDCEHMSDFNIHDKKYYEENYDSMAYVTLVQLYTAGELYKTDSTSERRRKLGEKLLKDLPDINKTYERYKSVPLKTVASGQESSENE